MLLFPEQRDRGLVMESDRECFFVIYLYYIKRSNAGSDSHGWKRERKKTTTVEEMQCVLMRTSLSFSL